jgi:hypothetical protein
MKEKLVKIEWVTAADTVQDLCNFIENNLINELDSIRYCGTVSYKFHMFIIFYDIPIYSLNLSHNIEQRILLTYWIPWNISLTIVVTNVKFHL